MMKDRLIVLLNAVAKKGKQYSDFAEQTGMKRDTVKNLADGKQRFNEEHIGAICTTFPQYRMWFAFGETIPEAGQISPELEETANNYGETGTDTK